MEIKHQDRFDLLLILSDMGRRCGSTGMMHETSSVEV